MQLQELGWAENVVCAMTWLGDLSLLPTCCVTLGMVLPLSERQWSYL